jgi:hypothetical protein
MRKFGYEDFLDQTLVIGCMGVRVEVDTTFYVLSYVFLVFWVMGLRGEVGIKRLRGNCC